MVQRVQCTTYQAVMPAVETWLSTCCNSSVNMLPALAAVACLLCSLTMMSSAELTDDNGFKIPLRDPEKPLVLSKSYIQNLIQPTLRHCCSAWLPHLTPHGCLRLFSMGSCRCCWMCALPST